MAQRSTSMSEKSFDFGLKQKSGMTRFLLGQRARAITLTANPHTLSLYVLRFPLSTIVSNLIPGLDANGRSGAYYMVVDVLLPTPFS